MAKLVLDDIGAGYASTSTINDNNTLTETALENTLSRDGTGPNQMGAQLDMNSYPIVNLPDAVANQSPVTLAQAAAIAGVENPLTQESMGLVLYPRTAAEIAAAVTPTYYHYPAGNVLRYGAVADGVTTDSAAFQAAADSNDIVYVPAGDYALATEVRLPAFTSVVGYSKSSVTLYQTGTVTSSHGMFYVNSDSDSSTVNDISIENMRLKGRSETLGFSEHQHLISASGVNRFTVRNCRLIEPQGDAIYISSVDGERHNSNVRIVDNYFNGGSSKNNRNGFSAIDCDGLIITGNAFESFCKNTMPGAIDLEPNANAYHVIKNVTISNNTFKDINSSSGIIVCFLQSATLTTPPQNFTITNNVFDSELKTGLVFQSAATYAEPHNVVFSGNTGNVSSPVDFQGRVDGVVISNNTFRTTLRPFLGFNTTDLLLNASITGNTLTGDGTTSAIGWNLVGGSNITFANNVYSDIEDYCIGLGHSSAGAVLSDVLITNERTDAPVTSNAGVEFKSGTFSDIRILDNDYTNATTAIQGSVPSGTVIRGNTGWVTENGGVTAAIATGATVTHGCRTTPNIVLVNALETGPTDVYVSSINSSNFTVNFGGGGSKVFAWEAKLIEHYSSA